MNAGDVIFAFVFVVLGIVNLKIIFNAATRDTASAEKPLALYFFQVMGLYGAYFIVHFFFYRFSWFSYSVLILVLFLLISFMIWLELLDVKSRD